MERERNDVTLVPSFLKKRWDVVKLGRWAGVFVLASALLMGAWEASGLFSDNPPHLRILLFWTTLVTRGSFGVIIILLAELVHAMRGDDLGYKDDYGDEDPAGET